MERKFEQFEFGPFWINLESQWHCTGNKILYDVTGEMKSEKLEKIGVKDCYNFQSSNSNYCVKNFINFLRVPIADSIILFSKDSEGFLVLQPF